MKKQAELYSGKAKTVYATDDPNQLIMHFRNDTSAFDGEKVVLGPQASDQSRYPPAEVRRFLETVDG